jgi:hypothetical protein
VIEKSIKQARDAINKISIKPTVFDLDNIGKRGLTQASPSSRR